MNSMIYYDFKKNLRFQWFCKIQKIWYDFNDFVWFQKKLFNNMKMICNDFNNLIWFQLFVMI